MHAPPSQFMASALKAVDEALAGLPPDTKGAIVGVATLTGVNLAVTAKINHMFAVVGWIGKDWGRPVEGGASIKAAW